MRGRVGAGDWARQNGAARNMTAIAASLDGRSRRIGGFEVWRMGVVLWTNYCFRAVSSVALILGISNGLDRNLLFRHRFA